MKVPIGSIRQNKVPIGSKKTKGAKGSVKHEHKTEGAKGNVNWKQKIERAKRSVNRIHNIEEAKGSVNHKHKTEPEGQKEVSIGSGRDDEPTNAGGKETLSAPTLLIKKVSLSDKSSLADKWH